MRERAIVLFVLVFLFHNAGAYERYTECKPIKDLIEQHRCLMRVAVYRDDHQRIKGLVEDTGYVDINETTVGPTYLQQAAKQFGNYPREVALETIRILLDLGADPNARPYPSPVGSVISGMSRAKPYALLRMRAVTLLLDHGYDVNTVSETRLNGRVRHGTLLFGAVGTIGSSDSVAAEFAQWLVEEYLRRGADVNWTKPETGANVLSLATYAAAFDPDRAKTTVAKLLDAGAEIEHKDSYGFRAIDYAKLYIRKFSGTSVVACTPDPRRAIVGDERREQSKVQLASLLMSRGSPATVITNRDVRCQTP